MRTTPPEGPLPWPQRLKPLSTFHANRPSDFGASNKMSPLARVASSFSSSSTSPRLSATSSPAPGPFSADIIHAIGSSALTPSADPTASADPVDSVQSSSSSRRSGFEGERPRSVVSVASSNLRSAPSTSSMTRTLADYEGLDHCTFFDGFSSSRGSLDIARREQDTDGFGLGSLNPKVPIIGLGDDQRSDIGIDDVDDDEDLRDLSALRFTRSIRMNLDALSRSSADQYAYSAGGYSDPNQHVDIKPVNDLHEGFSIEDSYAQLISRLAFADATYPDIQDLGQNFSQAATPRTLSLRNSPLTASLASGRSSSDVHEDELRTPPESGFDRFEASADDERHESTSQPQPPSPVQPSPISQAQTHAQTPSSSSPQPKAAGGGGHLGSPFKPSVAQLQQNRRSQDRVYPQPPFECCDVGDNSELELLSDDVGAQRRAAGKARAMPWHTESSPPSDSGHRSDRRRSPVYPVVEIECNKPYTRLGPQDIAFSASTLPERQLTAADCVDVVVSRYPSICDAPLRMFGEDGQPLPPTKKQETSDEERQARREALQVKFCAKQRLSLIKAMVVMESRSASWKRIGPLNSDNKHVHQGSEQLQQQEGSPRSSNEVGRLPPMPSAWSMDIQHEQLDVAQIKGKSKKTIELASLRTNAQCVKCDGSGLGACITCKAEQADECFWCCGTGREKTRAQAWCRRCQGAGVLKCNTCHGSLKSNCRSCDGTGTGEYGFFVDVTVKRVEMPAVPVSTLFPQMDSATASFEPSYDEVKAAATLALWDSITKLTEARSQAVMAKGGKAKSKEMVPVMAACMWENSITHVVAVDIPLAAKFKKGAAPALRPEGLHRKIPTKRRFFTVPNDEDLRSVELSEEEVRKLGAPQPNNSHVYQRRSSSTSPPSRSPSSFGSYESSPAASSVDLNGRPPLATPKSGGGASGYSTPSRVPSPRSEVNPAKPAAKEFVHRPSPLSQLAAATPTASSSIIVQQDDADRAYFGDPFGSGTPRDDAPQQHQPQQPSLNPKSRRPSAGQILSKKLSSNILNKFGAHRSSV